jgi:C4-dicarboxylate transporter
MAMSYLIGLPILAFLGYLSVKLSKPMIIAIGGPVVFLMVHMMFGVGVYLAGKNCAKDLLYWATKRFLQKYGD